jgi:tetratricopeptide (TPR) repeat protein
LVFEFHDAIQNLPGSTPARELLISRALEYLDKLANEAKAEASLQLELAAAYDKIGDIQGGFGTSQLGQRENADGSYKKALAIREALLASDPENVELRRNLATSYTKRGDILWVAVEAGSALEYYEKALEINRQLAAESPGDNGIVSELAISYRNVGYMHGASNRVDESLKNTRQAVALFETLAAADPNNSKLQFELALVHLEMAVFRCHRVNVRKEVSPELVEALPVDGHFRTNGNCFPGNVIGYGSS